MFRVRRRYRYRRRPRLTNSLTMQITLVMDARWPWLPHAFFITARIISSISSIPMVTFNRLSGRDGNARGRMRHATLDALRVRSCRQWKRN